MIPPLGIGVQTIPSTGGGIKLDGTVAKDADGHSATGGNWVQVVVLDDSTPFDDKFRVAAARSFNVGQQADLAKLIDPIKHDRLVILTGADHKANLSRAQTDLLRRIWKHLGGNLSAGIAPDFKSGQWSIVGQPDGAEGTAKQAQGLRAGPDENPGGMSGVLEKNTHNLYRFVFGQSVTYDTSVSGTPSGSNRIQVGNDIFSSSPFPAGTSGFQLVVLDPGTLSLKENASYITNNNGGPNNAGILNLGRDLLAASRFGPEVTVILQSVGNPYPRNDTWNALTAAVSAVGGTSDVFDNLNGKGGYVLVGGRLLPGRWGDELSGSMTGRPARLTGLFTRNAVGQMQSSYANDRTDYAAGLYQVVYGPGEAWPVWKTAGEEKIYRALASRDFLSLTDKDDLRTNYWYDRPNWANQRYKIDHITMDELADHGVTGVTDADLKGVKMELDAEIGWVIEIGNWISQLKEIYTEERVEHPTDVQKIAKRIYDRLSPDRDSHFSLNFFEVFSQATDLASVFVPGGVLGESALKLFGVFNAGLGMMSHVQTGPHGDPIDAEFHGKVSEVATELADRYGEAVRGLNRMFDILVSNYGKLRSAGQKVVGDWGLNTDIDNSLRDNLRRVEVQTTWEALLPATFSDDFLHATKCVPLAPCNPNPTRANTYNCPRSTTGGPAPYFPYKNEPDNGQELIVGGFTGSNAVYALHALGDKGRDPTAVGSNEQYFRIPSDSYLKDVFSTDRENENAAGLYKLEFFQRYFHPRDVYCAHYSSGAVRR